MCRKIIAEGELDNGNGQADVHAKVRRLPNYDFRFIGRLQLQRNTKQGIERGMSEAKGTHKKPLSLSPWLSFLLTNTQK